MNVIRFGKPYISTFISFTPVKPLKFTLRVDRFSMTFTVDGNGKNYLSDDFLFCV